MDKTLRDKMQHQEPEVCPHCGLPQADWRCRSVQSGYWCQSVGLVPDPDRVISSVAVDPMRATVEADPKVEHARAKLEAVQAEAERAHNEWEAKALAVRHAWQQRRAVSRTVVANGREIEVAPGAPTLGDISRLEAAATEAFTLREFAAEKAIAARTELDNCRQWVRAELEATAEVAAIRQAMAAV